MEIGEIGLRADRAVERFHIRRELDQVTRHEPRREPEVAENLHHQPRAVATRAGLVRERLLRRLHPRLHADQVADGALEIAIDVGEEVVRRSRAAVDRGHILREARAGRRDIEIGPELLLQHRVVGERPLRRALLDEEVEGIDDRHIGDEVDGDGEDVRLLGEHDAGEEVAVRVLLPVDEVGPPARSSSNS